MSLARLVSFYSFERFYIPNQQILNIATNIPGTPTISMTGFNLGLIYSSDPTDGCYKTNSFTSSISTSIVIVGAGSLIKSTMTYHQPIVGAVTFTPESIVSYNLGTTYVATGCLKESFRLLPT